jgi:tetratricopeptide (TPR) repeat protein
VAPSDFVSRGQALVASGQYQEAVKICRLGLLGRPTAVEGRIVLGQALLALRRYDEVLAEMRVALELENTSAAAYQLRGEALLRKGDAVAATEALTRARQLAQGDPSIAALLAEAEIARDGSSPGAGPGGGLGYVDLGDSMTKHYPSHQGDEPSASGSYTRPTTLQKPGAGAANDFSEEASTSAVPPSDKSAKAKAAAALNERTEIGKPLAPGRTAPQPIVTAATGARGDATPPPHVLSIGDRSGTVDLDPELDAVEDDDDIGDVVDPPSIDDPLMPAPRGKPRPATRKPRPAPQPAGPGAGHFLPAAAAASRASALAMKTPTVSLDDDDVIEVDSGISMDETPAPVDLEEIDRQARARAEARRVHMPSGPIEPLPAPPQGRVSQAQMDLANRPTAIGEAMPMHRPPTMNPPQMNAGRPHPSAAAALPTISGQHMMPGGGGIPAAATRATAVAPAINPAALSPAAQRSAAAIDNLFPEGEPVPAQLAAVAPMPSWAKNTVVAPGMGGGMPMQPQPQPMGVPQIMLQAPPQQGMQPQPHQQQPMRGHAPPGAPTQRPVPAVQPPGGDPAIGDFTGLLVNPGASPGPGAAVPTEHVQPLKEQSARHHRTGVRTSRRLKILLWVALGALVIGGGVFAGFQIRRIRLERQIDTAVAAAETAARPDTYLGWLKARDGFAGIVAARDTPSARAKVARARAVLAADFGDDVAGAKAAVEALGATGGGFDGAIARAYLAIAAGDATAATAAAKAALDRAPDDAAALAVTGRAALLAHKWVDAARSLKAAVDKDPRPGYLVGLAEAELGRRRLDEAKGNCVRSLALVNDHPATLIMRARVLAETGALATGELGVQVTGQLDKVIAEGQRPIGEQVVGVSPRQVADASLALVAVQIARKDAQAARVALDRSLVNRPADQRFAEDVIRALISLGQYTQARAEADAALATWPASVAARIGLAETQLVDGDAPAALETLAKAGALEDEPLALTLRGRAHLAIGDVAAARADLDAALASASNLTAAIVARTWVDLRAGEAAKALGEIQPLYDANGEDPAIATAYAAALRQNGTTDAARDVLQKITGGPEGPQMASAWLELARLERDVGDYAAARKAYGKAIGGRGTDAKLEAATLYIDDGDVTAGRDTLEALVKQAPNDGMILVQTARVRTLVGDLAGARELIARADKLGTAPKADLAREQGRLALKAADFKTAVTSLEQAIDVDDRDIEGYLLLLDAIEALGEPERATKALEDAKRRFGDKPERFLVVGKGALIAGALPDARAAFEEGKRQLEDKKRPPRRIAEALFGLGRCKAMAGDLAGAARDFEAGLKKDPTAVDVYLALGDMALEAGNPAKALAHYQAAQKYNPDYPYLEIQIGRTATTLGRRAVARTALEKYLALAPTGEHAAEAKRLLLRL